MRGVGHPAAMRPHRDPSRAARADGERSWRFRESDALRRVFERVVAASRAARYSRTACDVCFLRLWPGHRLVAGHPLLFVHVRLDQAGINRKTPRRQQIQPRCTSLPETCFNQNGGLRKLRAKGGWIAAAAAAGKSRADGEAAFDAATDRYEACHTALEALSEVAAGELFARLVSSMQGLMTEWRDYKRAAALLDFDDLLYNARDLLVRHEPVRQALAKRFRHVLVDEFQDTDPLQIEILWRLCGDPPADGDPDPLARKLRPRAGDRFGFQSHQPRYPPCMAVGLTKSLATPALKKGRKNSLVLIRSQAGHRR